MAESLATTRLLPSSYFDPLPYHVEHTPQLLALWKYTRFLIVVTEEPTEKHEQKLAFHEVMNQLRLCYKCIHRVSKLSYDKDGDKGWGDFAEMARDQKLWIESKHSYKEYISHEKDDDPLRLAKEVAVRRIKSLRKVEEPSGWTPRIHDYQFLLRTKVSWELLKLASDIIPDPTVLSESLCTRELKEIEWRVKGAQTVDHGERAVEPEELEPEESGGEAEAKEEPPKKLQQKPGKKSADKEMERLAKSGKAGKTGQKPSKKRSRRVESWEHKAAKGF